MKRFSCISALISMLMLAGCAADLKEEIRVEEKDEISAKLIHNSSSAEQGSLLVFLSGETAKNFETVTSTRSESLQDTPELLIALEQIGTTRIEPLFSIKGCLEERSRELKLNQWYLVYFNEDTDLDEAARKLAALKEVEMVEFNVKVKLIDTPKLMNVEPAAEQDKELVLTPAAQPLKFNDPYLKYQWHYINNGPVGKNNKAVPGEDINLAAAWEHETGDPSLVVAVVDEGVQYDHPDLAANMWTNPGEIPGNGIDDDKNGYIDDVHGWNFVKNTAIKPEEHGTHVAGTIAAVNGNGIGVCGIAGGSGKGDGVRIMSAQMFCDNGGGTVAVTARAVEYAAKMGACIVQASYGYTAGAITSDNTFSTHYAAEFQAYELFRTTSNFAPTLEGGLIIMAAGNDTTGMSGYPAAYREYLSVTSVGSDGKPAYYTNFGPGCNIAAPGGDAYECYPTVTQYSEVLSTFPTTSSQSTSWKGYDFMQGTSMACPHASGIAALGLSYALHQGKHFTAKEYISLLCSSVRNVNSKCTGSKTYYDDNGKVQSLNLANYKNKMGSGVMDAFILLMNIRGTKCIPVEVGKQEMIDVSKYIGDGNTGVTIRDIEIPEEAKVAMGISARFTSGTLVFKCTNPGSTIATIKFIAGGDKVGSGSEMGGMLVTAQVGIVARGANAVNGGWL